MDDFAEAGAELAERFRFAAPTITIEPVRPARPPAACAVDGSSAVLFDAGGLVVVAWRSAVAWDDGTVRAAAGPLRAAVRARKSDDDRPVDALRAGEEAAAALDALARLPPDGLLLLDGLPPAEVAGRLAATAEGRPVVAVSKSTGATLDGVPLVPAVRRAARAAKAATPWAARVGASRFVVRLSPAQDRLFVVDVLAGDAARALGHLASLGNNPGVPGYPFVLALAHQSAVLSEEEQQDARHRLLAAVAAAGGDPDEVALAFHDYHEELDLGA